MSSRDDVSDPVELRSLDEWLRTEDELRGHTKVVRSPIQDGHMGGLADAISVAVGNGGLAVVLVKSMFTWLGTRRAGAASKVTLKLKTSDGIQAEMDFSLVSDPTVVIDKVLGFLRNNESGLWIDIRTGSDRA